MKAFTLPSQKTLGGSDRSLLSAMYDALQNSVQSLGRFSEIELSLFTAKLKARTLPKGTYLLREGEVCRCAWFVNRGSLRQYQVTEEAEEITHNLFVEADWVLDYQSFTAQKPSQSCIRASEKSEVLELSMYDLHALIEKSGSFFKLGRLLEYALAGEAYRTSRLSPEDKYRQLLATKPRIIQKFPLKHIASYLDITPETLSRVRKKLTRSSDFLI